MDGNGYCLNGNIYGYSRKKTDLRIADASNNVFQRRGLGGPLDTFTSTSTYNKHIHFFKLESCYLN